MNTITNPEEAPVATTTEAQSPETVGKQPTGNQATENASHSDEINLDPDLKKAIALSAESTPVNVITGSANDPGPPVVDIELAKEQAKRKSAEPSPEAVTSTIVKLDKILEKEKAELAKPMTDTEKKLRDEKVSLIVKASSDMMVASLALKEIRDKRLYREQHETFEAFCKDVCEISVARASQLISAAKEYAALKDKIDDKLLPKSEGAFRQLRAVDDDFKVDVLELAVQLSDQNKPTGAAIQKAWDKLKEQKGDAAGAKKTKKVKPGKVLKQTQAAVALLKTADKKTFTLGELSELKSVFQAFTDAAEAIAKE